MGTTFKLPVHTGHTGVWTLQCKCCRSSFILVCYYVEKPSCRRSVGPGNDCKAWELDGSLLQWNTHRTTTDASRRVIVCKLTAGMVDGVLSWHLWFLFEAGQIESSQEAAVCLQLLLLQPLQGFTHTHKHTHRHSKKERLWVGRCLIASVSNSGL